MIGEFLMGSTIIAVILIAVVGWVILLVWWDYRQRRERADDRRLQERLDRYCRHDVAKGPIMASGRVESGCGFIKAHVDGPHSYSHHTP